MKELKNESLNTDNDHFVGLYIDGQRDKTFSSEKEKGKYYQTKIIEEHYSLVKEPGSSYVGHVISASETSLAIAKSIYNYITAEVNKGLNNIFVIGCDGTVINTGVHNRVRRSLELKIG